MAFDGFVTHGISAELNSFLLDGKIDKIYQPEKDEITILVRTSQGSFKVLISAATSNPRIHLTEENRSNPISAPLFCMILRKHLSGGRIKSISQYGFDRVIKIDVECYTEMGDLTEKSLIAEIMGKHSNIIFIQQDKKIIDSIRHVDFTTSALRQVLPGLYYELPPAQAKINPQDATTLQLCEKLKSSPKDMLLDKLLLSEFVGLSPLMAREIVYRKTNAVNSLVGDVDIDCFVEHTMAFIKNFISGPNYGCLVTDNSTNKPIAFSCVELTQYTGLGKIQLTDSLSTAVEGFFSARAMHDRLAQKSASTIKIINNNLDRCQKKITLHTENIRKSKKRDKYKIFGDLITANIYQLDTGLTSILLDNYYSENSEKVEIQLKPELTPSQNAQRYYRLYSKAKATEEHSEKQLKAAICEKEYLETVLDTISRAESHTDISEIRDELAEQGYISTSRGNKKGSQKKSKPMKFTSSDGYTILVGRNNKQNDELTIKTAFSTDIWLHTKNIPGSHILIRTEGQGEVPDRTLEEAAAIAAYYSKARKSAGVAVDYTLIKNIKKPNGSKPGFVIYETNYTIFIDPDEALVEMLKASE